MAREKLQAVCASVSERVQQLLKPDRFYVVLYDSLRQQLEFPWVFEHGEPTKWSQRPYSADWIEDAVIDQRKVLSSETGVSEVTAHYGPEGESPQSWLGVPMLVEDRVVGALVVESFQHPRAFGASGERILTTVAAQTAVAVERLRMDAHLARRLENLNAVYEVGQKLTSSIQLDVPGILELLYEQASAVMDTNNMYIALYDATTDTVSFGLVYLDGVRLNPDEVPGWGPRSGGKGRTEWIIQYRQPIFNRTQAESRKWYEQRERKEYIGRTFASWIGVPIIVGDSVLGVIATYHNTDDYVYDDEDLQVLELMAGQAAIALNNARLYESLDERVRERTKQLTALQDIGVKLVSQLDLREVLEAIVQHAAEVTGADFFTLFPYDSEKDAFEAGIRRGKVAILPITPTNTGFTARIAKTQEAVFVEDVQDEEKYPGVRRPFIQESGTRSFSGIPLLSRGKSVGVLYVNYFEPHLFSQEEREMTQLLVNQAAVAIENAMLFQNLENAQQKIVGTEAVLVRANFAADLVHRMNNVAGTIPVWVELIRGLLNDVYIRPEVDQYLGNIAEDAKGILNAVQQVKSPLEKQAVDLESLISSLTKSASLQFPSQITFRWICSEKLPKVYAILPELQHALWSLIQNGVEAMPSGGTLEISAESIKENDQVWIEIRVRDEGIGISPEVAQRIFSPFYTTKDKHTGYGLWRSKQTIEGMGGNIGFQNNPDRGVTFTITIPVVNKE
jgi:two-component system NtrC family sensor kinase